MAVTKSRSAERRDALQAGKSGQPLVWRRQELAGMAAALVLVGIGLMLVYRSKAGDLAEVEQGLKAKTILNLNDLSAREDLLPALSVVPDPRDREEVARKIYYLSGGLGNVGGIRGSVSGDQFKVLKPLFVVRRPASFRDSFFLWTGIFLACFVAVHVFWSLRRFRGDQTLLPAALLLSGLGLILMVSLRDPVRDYLLFADFAEGVAMGCALLAAFSDLDYERLFGKLSFVPLLASFGLSALLILFGRGPGTSDAKVNLFGFQPVEIIRILLVFFLAGYFATRWDVLRHARETRSRLAPLTSRFDIPPVEYTLPILVSVALSLGFFFLQRDMGPALVFSCLFLVLYGLARGSAFVPVVGLGMVVSGFVAGYFLHVPHTVRERVSMWLSPWNNMVHGGDQLAHSLWAFSTGGLAGMGIGRGDPQFVPAGHTDLILSALGEELGFLGVALVFGLFALIVWRSFRIASRARTDYEFFLAAGLAAATVLQILLIAGGALGVLPLSGVVTPFLSYGRTAMLANFAVLAILVSISARSEAAVALPDGRGSEGDAASRGAVLVAGAASGSYLNTASEPRPSGSGCATAGAASGSYLNTVAWIFAAAGLVVAGQGRLVQAPSRREATWGRARWWCRPMARAAISTIRASRTSCARSPRAPSTTATACRSPPATGTSWKNTAPITRPSASISTAPAPRTDTPPLSLRRPDVRSAGRPAHAHPLGRHQYLLRGARFGAPPARL